MPAVRRAVAKTGKDIANTGKKAWSDTGAELGRAGKALGVDKWRIRRRRHLLDDCPPCAKKSDLEKLAAGVGKVGQNIIDTTVKAAEDSHVAVKKGVNDGYVAVKKGWDDTRAEGRRFAERVCGKGTFTPPSVGGALQGVIEALQTVMAAYNCASKFSLEKVGGRRRGVGRGGGRECAKRPRARLRVCGVGVWCVRVCAWSVCVWCVCVTVCVWGGGDRCMLAHSTSPLQVRFNSHVTTRPPVHPRAPADNG